VNDAPAPLADLLGASVRVGEARVGWVDDVFVDQELQRVVGLQVAGHNGRRWFLPWVAATFESGLVRASSSLVFVAADQLDFYVERGVRLSEEQVVSLAIDPHGRLVGPPATSVLSITEAGVSAG
jgi:PRC-barrel domain